MTRDAPFRLRCAVLYSPVGRRLGDKNRALVPPRHLVIAAKAGIHFDVDLGTVAKRVKHFSRLPASESLLFACTLRRRSGANGKAGPIGAQRRMRGVKRSNQEKWHPDGSVVR